MYLIFQIFRDEPRLGGDKPWSKNGDKFPMGGIDKIFARWGPPVPPGKVPCFCKNEGARGHEAGHLTLEFAR